MRNIFFNAQQQKEFEQKGYVKVSLLSSDEVSYLKKELTSLRPDDNFDPSENSTTNHSTYHCTFLDTNKAYKREVQGLINKVFTPHINKFVDKYDILTSNFYVKPPGKGKFEIHQNWPTTADMHDTTLTFWCPLVDVTLENGAIQVVEGSHKIVPDIAAITAEPYFKNFEDALLQKYLKPIDMKAGECLIFDDGLIHYSGINQTENPRLAIQIETLPAECTPVLYHLNSQESDKGFELFEVNSDFYIDYGVPALLQPPAHLKSLGFVPNPNRLISEAEFAEKLKNGDKIRERVYAGGAFVLDEPVVAIKENFFTRLWKKISN